VDWLKAARSCGQRSRIQNMPLLRSLGIPFRPLLQRCRADGARTDYVEYTKSFSFLRSLCSFAAKVLIYLLWQFATLELFQTLRTRSQ
jgi:hypothetical protein